MTPASERLRKYIEDGRKIVRTVLEIDFDTPVWQLPYNRAHMLGTKKLIWKGVPPNLAMLGKAIVANESLPMGGKGSFGRFGFPVLLRVLGEIAGEQDMTTLGRKVFDLTCQALENHTPPFSPFTLKRYAATLSLMVKILNLRQLTEIRIDWSNPFPEPEKSVREHLIPPEVLKAFGEIRSAVMVCEDNDQDRLLVHAITILICTGMRVGELLTMPADCWHEGTGEDDEGRILQGVWLGYTPEKQGLNEDTMPRWIPTLLIPIVKESVDEILRITAPFRENSRALAEGQVNLDIDLTRRFDLREVGDLLGGLTDDAVSRGMKQHGVAKFVKGAKAWVTGVQIESYIREISFLEPVMTDPFHQALHESLFVVPHLFFFGRSRNINPVSGTAKRVTPPQIATALRSQGNSKSLFERFDKLDPTTGKPYSFASHDPRHTLTTWQIKHGIDAVRVAAYFGRDIQQAEYANSFYDHLTQEQRMALVDNALATGHFRGGWANAIAKVKSPLKKAELRHLLAGNVGFSQLGICAHPEGTTPPTMPEACSTCPGLIVIPGSPGHQKRALEIQAEIEQKIAVYEAQVADGVFMAGKWLDKEYERQAGQRRVVEVLFSKDSLEPGEEPTLVQMGNSKNKEC